MVYHGWNCSTVKSVNIFVVVWWSRITCIPILSGIKNFNIYHFEIVSKSRVKVRETNQNVKLINVSKYLILQIKLSEKISMDKVNGSSKELILNQSLGEEIDPSCAGLLS